MENYIKRYKIKLKTLSPVFIGSGKEINKKEYVYYRNSQEVYIPDMNRLFHDILKRNLDNEYQQYLMSENMPLLNWLKSVGYSDSEIKKLCNIHMDCSDALENLNRPIAIQQFVRDAYGLPYIPGSSLKGAIRTCLLAEDIMKNPEKYDRVRRNVINADPIYNGRPVRKFLSREIKQAESLCFNNLNCKDGKREDVLNDEMKGVIISDSKPLKYKDLTLCQKVDIGLNGGKNALNILRESLRTGVTIEFDLSIDTKIVSLTKADIEQAVQNFYNMYKKVYVDKFIKTTAEKNTIYLGGGCGYGTKTVMYNLLTGKSMLETVAKIMNVRFRKHGHNKDVKNGVSPHMLKCTNYCGNIVEMGKCRIEISEES